MTDSAPQLCWTDRDGQPHTVRWRSLAGHAPPQRVELADDTLGAAAALRLAGEGIGLLWCGDYQNARHLLQAMDRRLQARAARDGAAGGMRGGVVGGQPPAPAQAFQALRRAQAERARVLGLLLLPFDADHGLPLRRAPDLRAAAAAAHGPVDAHYVGSLRELLGVVGAHEWRKKGVSVPALGASIHPHHGVFAPVRSEYVDLVAQAPLPVAARAHGAFDIGTGTGVLAAVLARRGLVVVATDLSAAALACARDNLARLQVAQQVSVLQADLFPPGRAGLVVCNPPWLPLQPSSLLEAAVYDPDSRMLRGFLQGLAQHLVAGGEGWLILSDLAEHLGLRERGALQAWIADGGLHILGRIDIQARHRRALDKDDPLHAARSAEITTLWRLGLAS